jgi:hypothetical protein
VLSFDITHQLTDLLIAIEAAAHHHDPVAHHHDPVPPALAAVFINPPNPAPRLHAEPVPVPDHAWHTQPGGATGVLAGVAAVLRSPAGVALLTRARQTRPDQRLLAYTLTYQCHGWAGPVRRVDAVDTDRRLYRVARSGWDGQMWVSVHDHPELTDPPTRAALAHLLAASQPW